jgi:protein TonB
MTMQFSYSNHGNSKKATQFMVVAGLHVVLGTLFVHSLSIRKIPLSLPEPVLVMLTPDRPTPPPPPPEPPKPTHELAPPDIVIPKQEVPVVTPPEPTVKAAVETDTPPQPAMPANAAPEGPPATTPSTGQIQSAGQMRSAVFADANSCALPDYPSSAARNGETGTTTLALLVGTDGRVSSARIQGSSGSRVLDRAALNALSLCKFKAATNNGVAEAGWAQLAYVWKLD